MNKAFVYDTLWLDNDLGIDAGEQIWGHPKQRAEFSEYSIWFMGRRVRRVITVTDSLSGEEVLHASLPVLGLSMKLMENLSFPPFIGATPGDWWDVNGPQQYSMTFDSMESISGNLWNPVTDRVRLGQGTPQMDMIHDLKFIPIMVMDYHEFEIYCSEPTPIH